MTEDEKTQRIIAEKRHNQIVDLLASMVILLTTIVAKLKKEGE